MCWERLDCFFVDWRLTPNSTLAYNWEDLCISLRNQQGGMWLCHKRRYSKMTFMITSLFCIRLKFSLSYHRDSTELSLSFTGPSLLWRALAAWPCYQSKVVATMPLCPWHGTEPTNIHFRKRSVFLHMIHHRFANAPRILSCKYNWSKSKNMTNEQNDIHVTLYRTVKFLVFPSPTGYML